MFLVILLLALAIAEKCSSTTFPNGMTLEFNTRDSSTHFALHVPEEIFHQWEWAGIGIKRPEDGTDMTKTDIYSVIFKESILGDRWAEENAYPPFDTDLGGESNAKSGPVGVDPQGSKIFSWNRDFNTEDIYDIELIPETEYYVLWAYGALEENGDLAMHNDCGYETFIFIDCEDTTMEVLSDAIGSDYEIGDA